MKTRPNVHAQLAERDRALPGLCLLFEPHRLGAMIEAHAGVEVSSIEPLYLRYKEGTNCLVSYAVRGSMGVSHVYAKAYRRNAHGKMDKAVSRDALDTWLGRGPLVSRDQRVTVWAHPADARLRMLRHLAEQGGRELLLRRGPKDLRDALGVTFRAMSYKPERRFVTELRPSGSGSPAAVLKMYTPAGYEEAAVRTRAPRSGRVVRVPRQLGHDSRRHVLFLEWLPGRLAAELIASDEAMGGQAALIGQALAELHGQPTRAALPRSSSYDMSAAVSVIDDVERVFPTLRAGLARLRSSIAGLMQGTEDAPVPVHGDLHFRQILLSPESVAFVDFDRAGPGPAAGDLACCIAHLERDVLAGALSRPRADAVVEELLRGYERMRSLPTPHTLDTYTAAALALLLAEPFRLFHPDAFDLTARMLERALFLVEHRARRMAVS